MQDDEFEWDDDKAAGNFDKHGIPFNVASLVFRDPLSVTIIDPHNSEGEFRFVTIGEARPRTLLVVAHVYRGELIRIFSARRATAKEKRRYMNRDYDEIRDDNYEMLPEYDFSNGVRGKYYSGRTVMVMLDKDVAIIFPTGKAVNAALRQLIAEGRIPEPVASSTD